MVELELADQLITHESTFSNLRNKTFMTNLRRRRQLEINIRDVYVSIDPAAVLQ